MATATPNKRTNANIGFNRFWFVSYEIHNVSLTTTTTHRAAQFHTGNEQVVIIGVNCNVQGTSGRRIKQRP